MAARVLLSLCIACLLVHTTVGLKWRMFPNILQEECIAEEVPQEQWEQWMERVEDAFKKGQIKRNGVNMTEKEFAMLDKKIERQVSIDIGIVTEAVGESDDTPKPITYWVLDPKGVEIYRKEAVTEDQVNLTPQGRPVSGIPTSAVFASCACADPNAFSLSRDRGGCASMLRRD